MKKYLFIVRGIPGSGKSSLAELLTPSSNICTADDFHMKDGKYDWKVEDLRASHEWCQSKVNNLMKEGVSPVVVANTSTTVKEMQPYFDMAAEHGYTVYSLIVENRHGGVNIHSVPDEALERMRNRFDIKL